MLPGNWTAVETEKVLGEWLVANKAQVAVHAVACHSDLMAEGALRALTARRSQLNRAGVLVLGCDGWLSVGQRMVTTGALAATTVLPTTVGKAVELTHGWFAHRVRLPPSVMLAPQSFPALTDLRAHQAGANQAG
jgi:ABC-type sugar transport system substrate-binding protein